MSIRKTIFTALSLLFFMSSLSAQNTNSPYSRYGYGTLENPALGQSRAMGGIAYGMREKGMINPLNPASYSAVDTLNFVFDFGVSTTTSIFEDNSGRQVNPNGRFDYLAMKIPLKSYWGLALGLMPFSNVGYEYSSTETTSVGNVSYVDGHVGTGGLNTLFLGTGISLGKNWSVGANLKYIFGKIAHDGSVVYSNSEYNTTYSSENWYLGAPSLDFGVQYRKKFNKKNSAVLGATFTNGSAFTMHEFNTVLITPSLYDTVQKTTNPVFELPNTFGIGLSYNYDNRLTVGFDYQNQAWSKTEMCGLKDTLNDNSRMAVGLEFLPSLMATNYFKAIKYRCGVNYSNSYLNYGGAELKNIGLSVGFGLPLRAQKTVLNFAFEAGKLLTREAPISERYYKVSLDVSFNEFWFFKRKL